MLDVLRTTQSENNAKIVILFLLIFVMSSCSQTQTKKQAPLAEKGVIDLMDWVFEKNGSANLDEEWEFYWNQNVLDQKNETNRKADSSDSQLAKVFFIRKKFKIDIPTELGYWEFWKQNRFDLRELAKMS